MTAPMTHTKQAMLELADAGERHAEGLSAKLSLPHWTPSRAHVEQARNSITKLAAAIRSAQQAEAGEPVAWRCFDKIFNTWHVIDDAEHARARSRRDEWKVVPLYPAPVLGAGAREALEAARQEIVLTIAFFGRDAGTERLPDTIASLTTRLAKADRAILAALADTVTDTGGRGQGAPEPSDKAAADEAYRLFPDDVEPVDYHPAGKIVVDRGNLRYAFITGAAWASQLPSTVTDTAQGQPEITKGVRQPAQGKITAELMNATTVSCTGNEITIFCNDHDTKDALMDALTDAAYALPSTEAPAQGASIVPEAKFLLDRLQEFDPGDFDAERDFHGHVAPAIARLRNALYALPSTQSGDGK